MKIEISTVRNGFMIALSAEPTSTDPFANRNPHAGEWFARDVTDLMGRIAEAVHHNYENTVFSD